MNVHNMLSTFMNVFLYLERFITTSSSVMMISVTYSFVLKRKEHYLDEEDICVQ